MACDDIVTCGANDCPCDQRNFGSTATGSAIHAQRTGNARDWCADRDPHLGHRNLPKSRFGSNKSFAKTAVSGTRLGGPVSMTGVLVERFTQRLGLGKWRELLPSMESRYGGQPDVWYRDEDCVEISLWNDGYENDWNDSECSNQKRYICEAGP